MIILSHRGYWKTAEEKNSRIAFVRSFQQGFGTETDVRNCGGRLVVSHDPPTGGELSWAEMLGVLDRRSLPIAVNIKADGIARAVAEAMRQAGVVDWFTFDMSVPEMLLQLRLGLPVMTRASEYEEVPACLDQAMGVWLDAFHHDWYDDGVISHFLDAGKRVCIVSAELHKRDHRACWERLARFEARAHPGLMLCTDRPEEAAAVFGDNQ
jgi:hypothetical protein